MKLTEPKQEGTLFDLGYDHGILWGPNTANGTVAKNSWAAQAQYKAGVRLGQQEHRKRKLQQLVLQSPT